MTTASADSSGSYQKQWMELSQNYGSSGLDYSEDTFEPFSEDGAAHYSGHTFEPFSEDEEAHYSEDTFEPFSEDEEAHYSEDTFEPFSEDEEAHWQQEHEPSESCCGTEDSERSVVSDTVESMSWSSRQNHAGEQSTALDSAAVEREVLGKWIDLQTKEADIKQDKSVIKTHTERAELLDGELDALRSFCAMKISKMRQQLNSKHANGGKARKLQHGFTARKCETSDVSCLVPDQLMNRICLKNIRETVKQVTEAQIHESSVCPDCQKKEAELAKITFLRRRKMLMESALIQEKLEEQIYSRDVLTLIGEALRSFPKPSEDLTAKAERSEKVRPECSKHNSRT